MDNTNSNSGSDSLRDAWSIRPCFMYKDEYDDCSSIKARFNQYFIFGELSDCTQWQIDYNNCIKYENSNGNDLAAGEAVIRSETERRRKRMAAHYANDTWKKRASPPEDWAKPLPDWFVKRNENSYLEMKQMEMNGQIPVKEETKSLCVLM